MSSKVSLSISGFDSSKTPSTLGVSFSESTSQTLAETSGDGDADVIFALNQVLTSGSPKDFSLSSNLDAYGEALDLSDVAALYIECPETNADVIIIKPASSNGWTAFLGAEGVNIAPGSKLLLTGFSLGEYPVTPTSHEITMDPGASAGDVYIRLLGRKN